MTRVLEVVNRLRKYMNSYYADESKAWVAS